MIFKIILSIVLSLNMVYAHDLTDEEVEHIDKYYQSGIAASTATHAVVDNKFVSIEGTELTYQRKDSFKEKLFFYGAIIVVSSLTFIVGKLL